MTWSVWLREGRVERHRPEHAEIEARRRAAERSLHDAALAGLSAEGRFQLAYVAALELATVAVLAAGYRVKARLGHHQLTFLAAGVALGSKAAGAIPYFDRCRRIRNVVAYDGDEVGEDVADELVRRAEAFKALVEAWLEREQWE